MLWMLGILHQTVNTLLPLTDHTVALWRCGQGAAIMADIVSVLHKRLVHVGIQRSDVGEIDKLQNSTEQ